MVTHRLCLNTPCFSNEREYSIDLSGAALRCFGPLPLHRNDPIPHKLYSISAQVPINKYRHFFFEVLPEVFLGDVGAVPELAEVADPDVPLEAHQDGAVD